MFRGTVRLNARDSNLSDDHLRKLGQGVLPSLTSLDVSGCQHMTSVGLKALLKGLGQQIKEIYQDITPAHSSCKEMRVTPSTLKVLATAPGLECLSLTLSSAVKVGLNHLNSHATLRTLSIFFEGFHPPALPQHLPNLETLNLRVGPWTYFTWPRHPHHQLAGWDRLSYPKLRQLTIKDATGDQMTGTLPLNGDGVLALCFCFPKATVVVRSVAKRSDIPKDLVPFSCDISTAHNDLLTPYRDWTVFCR
jgi:hypothetical protein